MRRTLLTEDHEDFRQSVRAFLDEHAVPHLDAWREGHGIPREFWLACGERELLGLEIPEEHGGVGAGDYRFNAVLLEELARVSMALASSVSIHCDVVTPYLVQLTDEDQKRRWLPAMARGEKIAAIAMTEPSAGSDLAAVRSRLTPDGDDYRLTGSKTFITNGGSADLVVVAASSSPERRARGLTLVVVEAGMPGVSRGRVLDKVGQSEADTAELHFDDVAVPRHNVLGTLDEGFIHMMEFLPQERLGAAVANLAHARSVVEDDTLPYVRERQAFGQPVGTFQHNAFALAEMVTKLDVTQAFVDACVAAHSDGALDAVDAAKAKWWTAELQNEVIDRCLQLHGGYGYMDEYRVARAWRDARVTKIWAGSNEIMKEIVSRSLKLRA